MLRRWNQTPLVVEGDVDCKVGAGAGDWVADLWFRDNCVGLVARALCEAASFENSPLRFEQFLQRLDGGSDLVPEGGESDDVARSSMLGGTWCVG